MTIKWGSARKMAVRINAYDGKGWNRYWNMKEHVLQDDKAIRKTIGKYTTTQKVFAIVRDKDGQFSANGGGWTINSERVKIFSTHDQAVREITAKKLKAKVTLLEK